MTSSNITIKCPECGHEFDISDVLYDQVEHDLKAQYEARLKTERDRFRAESEKLAGEREQLEKAREEQRDAVQSEIREGLGLRNESGNVVIADVDAGSAAAAAGIRRGDIIRRVTTRYDNLFRTSFPYSMGFHAPQEMARILG